MEPDERMDGRMTGGRGETRDAWKKKEEGNHRGIHRSRGNDSGRG